jgi:hypothetical protein
MLSKNQYIGLGVSLVLILAFAIGIFKSERLSGTEGSNSYPVLASSESNMEQVINRQGGNSEMKEGKAYLTQAYSAEIAIVEQDVSGVSMPEVLDFAGEEVPLDIPDVAERLDREMLVNAYWHSNTILTLKLANKYLPEIERVLEENGVPQDFKYLAIAESGLRNLVSPAKAVGFWQILKGTAIEYGLTVNDQVDERYDYVKSTEAACKYLLEAYEKFGSWTLAAASYNMGMGGVSSHLKDQQVENYYDLYLNTETSRYVFRILALKHLFMNPELYGFNISEQQLYQPDNTKEVAVTSSISNLASYAKEQGTNYKTLKLLNPWLRSSTLGLASGDSYTLLLPADAVPVSSGSN